MKKYFLVLIIVIGTISTYAQQKCATIYDASKLTPETRKSVENFYDRVESLIQNPGIQMAVTNNFNPGSGVVLIPVVVHVVHNTVAQNISNDQICSQIDILNEDFSRRNPDSNQTPAQFFGVAANTEIQFYLATRDPNGNVTNGITRTATTDTLFSDDDRVKSTSTGGRDPWDTNEYLNIWVCILDEYIGYAQFPWDYASNPDTDGVVIDFTAFGDEGTVEAPYDLGRTATHEVGHWLGLKHIWGGDNGACTGSDGIADTPNQGNNYVEQCPLPNNMVSCSSNDMYMNYMDYTDDACMNIVTNGQKIAMRATLNTGGYREDFGYFLPTISGASTVCTSNSTFTLNNIPVGVTVRWTATPSNLFNSSTQSGNGTTATVQAASSSTSGAGQINFTISGDCGNTVISKNIWVGNPPAYIFVKGTAGVCPDTYYTYEATSPSYSTEYTYTWTYPSNWMWPSQYKNKLTIKTPIYNPQYGTVRVTISNTCGSEGPSGITVYPGYGCGYYYSYSPNPVIDELTVAAISTANEDKKVVDPSIKIEFEIKIYDSNKVMVRSEKSKGNEIVVNTAGLKKGTYFLHIIEREKVIKQEQILVN